MTRVECNATCCCCCCHWTSLTSSAKRWTPTACPTWRRAATRAACGRAASSRASCGRGTRRTSRQCACACAALPGDAWPLNTRARAAGVSTSGGFIRIGRGSRHGAWRALAKGRGAATGACAALCVGCTDTRCPTIRSTFLVLWSHPHTFWEFFEEENVGGLCVALGDFHTRTVSAASHTDFRDTEPRAIVLIDRNPAGNATYVEMLCAQPLYHNDGILFLNAVRNASRPGTVRLSDSVSPVWIAENMWNA